MGVSETWENVGSPVPCVALNLLHQLETRGVQAPDGGCVLARKPSFQPMEAALWIFFFGVDAFNAVLMLVL